MSKTARDLGNGLMGCGCAMMLLPLVVLGFAVLAAVLAAIVGS